MGKIPVIYMHTFRSQWPLAPSDYFFAISICITRLRGSSRECFSSSKFSISILEFGVNRSAIRVRTYSVCVIPARMDCQEKECGLQFLITVIRILMRSGEISVVLTILITFDSLVWILFVLNVPKSFKRFCTWP